MYTINVTERLNWRYATKVFDPSKKIPEKDFEILKESLRLSPSSFGLQPWKFLIIDDTETRKKLREHAWGQSQVTDASKLIVLCIQKNIDEKYVEDYLDYLVKVREIPKSSMNHYKEMMIGFVKKLTKDEMRDWMTRQVYIALGTLMTSSAMLQIDSCPMEGFDPKKFDEALELDKYEIQSVVLCALGYRSKDDKNAINKKVRFSNDKVFINL